MSHFDLNFVQRILLLGILVQGGMSLPADAGRRTPALRTVEVLLAADTAFRTRPGWRGDARRALEEATADLAATVGLAFRVVETRAWDPPPGAQTWPARAEALARETGGREILPIAFLGEAPPERGDGDLLGYAYLGRPPILVRRAKGATLALTLRHEIGHVFGLPHLPGRNVMAERAGRRSADFDAVSLDVLRANRAMALGAKTPFLGSDLDVLRDAYLLWAARGGGRARLLLNLGIAFRREGRPRDAVACLETAVRLDGESAPAWRHLGLARRDLGDRAGARAALRRSLALDPEGARAAETRRALETLR